MNNQDFKKRVADALEPVKTVINMNQTIEEAIQSLRSKDVTHTISYFYVVDDQNKLVGVVPTRKLLFCDPKLKIASVMESSTIKVRDDQTLQDAMEVFANRNLLALPVVDKDERLVGMIDVGTYTEESFDVADAQHRQDVFQMIGVTIEEEKKVSMWKHYRLRMPWLFCNIFAGVVCAIISRINEEVLSRFLLLAMFIPLVLTLSESTSMQSMTQSLQFLRRPRFKLSQALRTAFREWQVMIIVAISCGLFVGGVSLFWGDGALASFTIASGIFIGITTSVSFGILIPIFLHTTRLDPKVASGPVVLMFADILTTLLYLTLASWWLL